MAVQYTVDALASSARTAGSTTSSTLSFSSNSAMLGFVNVNVTDQDGQPTLEIQVQTNTSGNSTYFDLPGAHYVIEPVGTTLLPFHIPHLIGDSTSQVQVIATVGGKNSPSVTFSVDIATLA